jgi:hypothetical protein
VRSYGLLDGIGDTELVRKWTRENVRFLAEGGLEHGEAYGAPRALSAVGAVEARRPGAVEDGAVAVLAVVVPEKPVTIVWCGDARAYHQPAGGGDPVLLTRDHNMRQQALDAGRRNVPDDWRHVVHSHLADITTTRPSGRPHSPPGEVAGCSWPPRRQVSRNPCGVPTGRRNSCVDLALAGVPGSGMKTNGMRMLMVLVVLVQLMAIFQHQVMGQTWQQGFTVGGVCALVGLCAARVAGARPAAR